MGVTIKMGNGTLSQFPRSNAEGDLQLQPTDHRSQDLKSFQGYMGAREFQWPELSMNVT